MMSTPEEHIAHIKQYLELRKREDAARYVASLDFTAFTHLDLLRAADMLTRASLMPAAKTVWSLLVARTPLVAEVRNNYGMVLYALREFEGARQEFEEALRLRPNFGQAYLNIARVYRALHEAKLAEESFRRAIEVGFASKEVFQEFATFLIEAGQFLAASDALTQGLALYPQDYHLLYLKGVTLLKQDSVKAALDVFSSIEARPEADAVLYFNMGSALNRISNASLGSKYLERALSAPRYKAVAMSNLAFSLALQGRAAEAIQTLRQAVREFPDNPKVASMFCLAAHYDGRITDEEMCAIHRTFGSHFPPAKVLERKQRSPIRIGFVSADFKQHSVAYFLKALFSHLDRKQFHVTGISGCARPDAVTTFFRNNCDQWVDSTGLSDKRFVETARSLDLDIAIDLAGHTNGNRLACFAERLAPIQITYLGYPNSSGLSAMDYRLTDLLSDPAGYEKMYTEKLLRLEPSFLCYGQFEELPPVSEAPVDRNKHVTFGSFHGMQKVNDIVLNTWAQILASVPSARLVMKAPSFVDNETKEYIVSEYQKRGIQRDRITLEAPVPSWRSHMESYGKIDIALDTFPYNGTTTTLETLSMGVPVVALTGTRHAGRVGYSILTNLGLPELIADTVDSYVTKAVLLAEQPERIVSYRRELRRRLQSSVLMDAERFTRSFEAALKRVYSSD